MRKRGFAGERAILVSKFSTDTREPPRKVQMTRSGDQRKAQNVSPFAACSSSRRHFSQWSFGKFSFDAPVPYFRTHKTDPKLNREPSRGRSRSRKLTDGKYQ